MAWHQRHLRQIGDVPGTDDDAARIGVAAQLAHDLGDLVDVAAIGRRPGAPLHAVDRAEVAVGARPFVPDRHAAFLQPARVAVAAQEPEQFEDDGLDVHLLRRDERKALGQIEAHLVAEDALRAGAGAVGLEHAMVAYMAHEVFVLAADGAAQEDRLLAAGRAIIAKAPAPDRLRPPARAGRSRRGDSSRARHRCRCRRSVRAIRGRPFRCAAARRRALRCSRARSARVRPTAGC